jgi:hypothetical protein
MRPGTANTIYGWDGESNSKQNVVGFLVDRFLFPHSRGFFLRYTPMTKLMLLGKFESKKQRARRRISFATRSKKPAPSIEHKMSNYCDAIEISSKFSWNGADIKNLTLFEFHSFD